MSDISCVCDPATMFDQPYIQWIASTFAVCAYTTSDVIGFCLGLMNLVCWVFVHTPQLYAMFKSRQAGSLSKVMLAMWLTGDVTGVGGLLILGQTGPMLISQLYYLALDLTITCVTIYFSYYGVKPGQDPQEPTGEVIYSDDYQGPEQEEEREVGIPMNNSPIISSSQTPYSTPSNPVHKPSTTPQFTPHSTTPHAQASPQATPPPPPPQYLPHSGSRLNPTNPTTLVLIVACLIALSSTQTAASIHPSLHSLSTTLNSVKSAITTLAEETLPLCTGAPLTSLQTAIGTSLAWICSAIYSPSRLPQILLNYRRKSVSGISPFFISLPLIANSCYLSSIFIPSATRFKTDGFTSAGFWSGTFPYVLSTACGMVATFVIIFQMHIYRNNVPEDHQAFHDEEELQIGESIPGEVALDNSIELAAIHPSVSTLSNRSAFQRDRSNMSTNSKLNQAVGGLRLRTDAIMEGNEEEEDMVSDQTSMLGSSITTTTANGGERPHRGHNGSVRMGNTTPQTRGLIASGSTISFYSHIGMIEVPSFLTSRTQSSLRTNPSNRGLATPGLTPQSPTIFP